jgi:drug/metabolite transporter (DMT)-like permease
VQATNYVYLSPLVAIATSVIVMNEVITLAALAGALLILAGVALAER